MKSLNKTIILLGTALLLTIVAVVAYSSFFISMKNKTDATTVLFLKIAELSGKESSRSSAASVLKNESANIDKLNSYFFNESEIVAFTQKVEELGPQSGTIIKIESLEPGITEKSVAFLSFRVKATGTFADVVRLLVLLENFPGKFELKTVRLVRDAGSVTEGTKTKALTPVWNVEVLLSALNFVK